MKTSQEKQIKSIREEFEIKSIEYAALVHVYCRSFRASPERVINILTKCGIPKNVDDIEDVNPRNYSKVIKTLEADYRKRTNLLVNAGLMGITEKGRNPSYRDLRERLQSHDR